MFGINSVGYAQVQRFEVSILEFETRKAQVAVMGSYAATHFSACMHRLKVHGQPYQGA